MALESERFPVKWYRSTILCAFLVSVTGFTCPGIFGALNGMGAGGGASPDIANAANAIVFGVIAIGSPFVGGLINRITPRWGLVIGTLGYTPYAAGLYCVDRYGTEWLLLLGAVCIGISACFLWISSGAILLGYSEEHRKGRAISLKFTFQSLGGSIGGIISLALNIRKSWRGSVSHSTYIALMTVMSAGIPFALALPRASRIQRTDGKPVLLTRQPSLAQEFKLLKRIIKRPAVFLLIPMFIYSQWFLSYQWQFNFAYFSVRARALNSTIFYLVRLVSTLAFGQLLDWTRFKRSARAKIGLWVYGVTTGAAWIIGQVIQAHYAKTKPTLDWADSGFGLGCFVFTLYGFADPLVGSFSYWLVGSLSNEVNEIAFLASIINSLGSVGSTFGFVVSRMRFNYNGACALNTALFFLSFPGVAWVVYKHVTDTTIQSQFGVEKEIAQPTSEEGSDDGRDEKGPVAKVAPVGTAAP